MDERGPILPQFYVRSITDNVLHQRASDHEIQTDVPCHRPLPKSLLKWPLFPEFTSTLGTEKTEPGNHTVVTQIVTASPRPQWASLPDAAIAHAANARPLGVLSRWLTRGGWGWPPRAGRWP